MKRIIDKQKRRIKRKKHIRKRIFGTPERPRMSVFRSNKHLYVQVVDDSAGHTIAALNNLQKDNSDISLNVEGAIKLGEKMGALLKKKKVTKVVFDRNGYLYHGVVKAIADGARKSGIEL